MGVVALENSGLPPIESEGNGGGPMTSNLTKCFWAPPSVDIERFFAELRTLIEPFGQKGAFAGDNLVVFGRNLTFLSDDDFIRAFKSQIGASNYVGYGIMWRLYMFSWAAKTCLRRSGDFVECGVSYGASSAIMCNYLRFDSVPKKLYLYDTWGTDERVASGAYQHTIDTLAQVRATFSRYQNVILVPGFIPQTFTAICPEKIAFLHIDLNSASAEVDVLDHLFDQVVPGGIILFDDYGANGFAASQRAEDKWMKERGYDIAELPTGQGLVIK